MEYFLGREYTKPVLDFNRNDTNDDYASASASASAAVSASPSISQSGSGNHPNTAKST